MNSQPASNEGQDGSRAEYQEQVEARALAIAREEGRYEATELDRETARHEILEPTLEDEYAEERLSEDDRPDAGVAPGSSGVKVERVPLEDDGNVVEELFQEGVENADTNTRARSGSHREL
jgi:hypothetical protein